MIPRDRNPMSNAPSMDNTEELESEARDLPHDLKPSTMPWSPPTLSAMKAHPNFGRRESLLTRQLHSETEHTDDEVAASDARTSRTHSTWSNPSVASTAELTSDDGHSVASPSVSPPFPAANVPQALPLHVKPLDQPVKIVGQEDANSNGASNGEKTVEAGLGRKRCITFACRGKQEAAPERPVASDPQQKTTATTTSETTPPPQKKCSLKFVCPSRPSTERKPSEQAPPKRLSSPAPPARQASATAKAQAGKVHRGSDSTVTHGSPKSVRRLPPSETTTTQPVKIAQPDKSLQRRRYSTDPDESDEGEEAVRFHEFGTSDEEPEDWVQESTCHRSRLTVSDTLKKENVIRKACEEVEEEAVEEDEEAEKELDEGLEDDLDDDDDEDGGDDLDDEDDEDDEDEDDEESDDGFHSDDEQGFANSDEEDENDSDLEWWRPGGVSTAATSVEHLDRLAIVNSQDPKTSSSIGSASSGRVSPHHRSRPRRSRKSDNNSSAALPIDRERDVSPGLPDSTDFVCGTLDEDRPLEQAYLNRRKIREAAKRQPRPQDIDPSFPTSDPEMDEEDDEDLIDPTESEHDGLFHGALDEMHGKAGVGMGMERKPSTRGRHRSNSHRSPPTATATTTGAAGGTTTSTVRYHSPAPPKKKCLARSPAPPRLFNRSPNRMRSPAPLRRVHSPPPSPTDQNNHPFSTAPHLAQRNAPPTRTASLPRRGVGFASTTRKTNKSSSSRNTSHRGASSSNYNNSSTNTTDDLDREASSAFPSDSDDTTVVSTSHNHKNRRNAPTNKDAPTRRAAIDIVKGLDKKRQFRKEKLYQKKCAAAAAAAAEKAEKAGGGAGGMEKGNGAAGEKVKPGRGAERMRAIGLQLQNYHGKAEHILSL